MMNVPEPHHVSYDNPAGRPKSVECHTHLVLIPRTNKGMIKMKRLLAISIFVFIFVGNAYAPDVVDFHVYVDVNCEDEDTKVSIESYIKRELRSLQDVKILVEPETEPEDGKHLFYIFVLAIEHKKETGKTGGISFSYLFLEKFSLSAFKDIISKDSWKMLSIFASMNLFSESRNGLQIGNTENIDKLCKSLVVIFYTEIHESRRKSAADLIKLRQEIKEAREKR